MIEISHVTHAFGRRRGVRGGGLTVLEDVTLSIPDGGFVAFLGPSGCGKTSLLRMLDGLLMPSSGTITVDGKRVTGPSADRAIVFQEFNLFPWRAAQRNIEFPLEVQGAGREAYRRKAGETLGLVGLDQFGGFYPHQLSGGMKQRIGIARALSVDPKYLLMDEPFGALDPLIREIMQIELMKLLEDARKTVVFVTHSVDEAVFLADQIVIFSARPGRVIATLDIDIARPRWSADETVKASPEFVAYRKEIWGLLKQEVRQAIREEAVQVN
jgi:NitT/TauT family transport system ATP-binding protein